MKRRSRRQKRKREAIRQKAEDQIYQNITKPQNWGNSFGVTRRKNGEIVYGGFRSIVDRGLFRDAIEVFWRGDDLVLSSDAPYFKYVVDGYFTSSGKYIEGRKPWNEKEITRVSV